MARIISKEEDNRTIFGILNYDDVEDKEIATYLVNNIKDKEQLQEYFSKYTGSNKAKTITLREMKRDEMKRCFVLNRNNEWKYIDIDLSTNVVPIKIVKDDLEKGIF